jgi:release factor glutamine methyltransferase
MTNCVKKIYQETAIDLKNTGIKSAEIDTLVLLEFVSGKSREFLLANPDYQLSETKIAKLSKLIKRRKLHEPIAYVTGHKEFFGLDFSITPDVLIPRPETEFIVENILQVLQTSNHQPQTILDVGTGSGNIIISIAKNCNQKKLNYFASDISNKALKIAKKNAKKHQTKINFIRSDLFDNITDNFDLIIANLPYVPIGGSDNEEIKYEPQNAIFAEDNGTRIIKKFIADTKKQIAKNGMILLEIDPRNAIEISNFAKKYFVKVKVIKDLSSTNRFIKITND